MKDDYQEGCKAYLMGYGFSPKFKTPSFMAGYDAAKATEELFIKLRGYNEKSKLGNQ